MRIAAETGNLRACKHLAKYMYQDRHYAREVGHVEGAAVLALPAGVMEGHNDVPEEVLTDVAHWSRMAGRDPIELLVWLRKVAREGHTYCQNDGCEVMGQVNDFNLCHQCKTARYCGSACQKLDWNAGGHKVTCGTRACIVH